MTTRPKVLYTDPPWLVENGVLNPARASLETEVFGDRADLLIGPFDGGRYRIDSDELLDGARAAQVVVIYRCHITPALLQACGPDLRAVIRQGVGVDNLHADLLAGRGVAAFNVPDYCVDEVSTHTAALALAVERGVVAQHTTLVGGRFDIYAGGTPRRLSRRCLGIVGFGRIGRAVARKLGPFFGRTVVYDPHLGRDLAEGYGAMAVADLGALFEAADLVTLHCPLTTQTRHMIDRRVLSRARDGAVLINAARGALIDPAALAGALTGGQLAGAGLDVFAPENPHDDPAWAPVLAHPNVVVTAHRAFLSTDAEASSRARVAELVRDVLGGTIPTIGRVGGDGGS